MKTMLRIVAAAFALLGVPALAQPGPPPDPWVVTGNQINPNGLEIIAAPSTTGQASINVPQGTAPISPVNGDIWQTSVGLFLRSAGVTVPLNGTFVLGGTTISLGGTFGVSGTPVASLWMTSVNINGGTITGLPSPTNPSDAATKSYVDNSAAGITPHTQAVLGTAAALPANTYNNGASGVGATLTANSNAALTVDGTAVSTTQRIVVKNEAAPANNGIYVVTATGSGGAPYVLTRSSDANTPGLGNPNEIGFGTYVLITTGTVNAGSSWTVNSTVNNIGADAINWAQFTAASGVATISNSDGSVTVSPNTGAAGVSINVAHTNIWPIAQEFLVNATTPALSNIKIDTPGAGQTGAITLFDNGTAKWILKKDTGNNFQIYDLGRNVDLSIAPAGNMALMPNGGSVSVGNSTYADNSGLPYCNVRNATFGTAGQGSNSADQAAFAAALLACQSKVVFIPCGVYGNTAPWSVYSSAATGGTIVITEGRSCVSISTTQTAGSVFVCTADPVNGANGGFAPVRMSGMQIFGTGALTSGTVPTSGYAIDCGAGGNQQAFDDIEINGTYDGINIGGTNGHLINSRLEALYGTVSVEELLGGNTIRGNQLDNGDAFNSTGAGSTGFGTAVAYNTSSPASIAKGTLAFSGSGCATSASPCSLFIATVGGTTGPLGGGIPPTVMFKNITDGSVTWQFVGNALLSLVIPGTESWIIDNDMTSPAQYAVACDGRNVCSRNWIRGNDIAGETNAGIVFEFTATFNHVLDNQFFSIGYNLAGTVTGFPIWDQGHGDNQNNVITANTMVTTEGAILLLSDLWNITGNNFVRNTGGTLYCAIELFTSGGSPQGTVIVGNEIFAGAVGAICMTGGGGSRSVVVGNAVNGATISLTGTNTNLGNL